MKHEGDDWCDRNNPQRLGKETRRLKNQRTGGDHPNYSIIKISQKIPEDLKKLAIAQNPVKDHQLEMVEKLALYQ